MTDNQRIEPLLVPPGEAAKMLGLSKSFFYELLSSQRIPLKPVSFGRKKLYSVAEFRAYVAAGCPTAEKWQQIKAKEIHNV
jgi:excisionase family DNA binding protein